MYLSNVKFAAPKQLPLWGNTGPLSPPLNSAHTALCDVSLRKKKTVSYVSENIV